jgi:hypothetical protein
VRGRERECGVGWRCERGGWGGVGGEVGRAERLGCMALLAFGRAATVVVEPSAGFIPIDIHID